MCDIHETHRAFVLSPHKLGRNGTLLSLAKEFEEIQKGYDGQLEIVFIRGLGDETLACGFVICIPSHFSIDEVADATAYLSDYLKTAPRLVALSGLV